MPHSSPAGKQWVADWLRTHPPTDVLDVGPGSGTWEQVVHDVTPAATVDAIEVYAPYIAAYGLAERYGHIWVGDVREWDWGGVVPIMVAESPVPVATVPKCTWDVVILGDVLEHMTRAEALKVVDAARAHATDVFVSVPLGEWDQAADADYIAANPAERHVEVWTETDVATWFGDAVMVGHVEGGIGVYRLVGK